jgi:beta-lactamase regulating signal transducer with metallopeptidase domain
VPAPWRPPRPEPATLLWAFGTLACLLRLAAGRVALRRIARRAVPADAEWSALLADEAARADVRAPVRLLVDAGVAAPATWGVRHPVVVLPAGADAWPESRRRAVLRHELAHVARRDALVQGVAGVTCALYWFHPGVWLAARRLVAERERACDDRVLVSGARPADYAAELLDVARLARASGLPSLVTVSMARRTELEGRLLDVLDPRRARGRPSRAAGLAGAVLAGVLVVALSAFRAVPREAPATPVSRPISATPVAPPPVAARVQPAVDSVFEQSIPATSGGRLTLDLPTGGELEIAGGDGERVTLHGTLAGASWRGTRVTFERWPDGVRLVTKFEGDGPVQSFAHRFVLRVPRRYDVRVFSAGGRVTIHDLEGSISGNTGGGGIRVERASGDLSFTTGGGDVFVFDSHLTGRVSTGGGEVLIDRVTGGLSGHSGTGDVTYAGRGTTAVLEESAGDVGVRARSRTTTNLVTVDDKLADDERVRGGSGLLLLHKAGGTITLAEAPHGAVLSTGGGAIEVGRAAGLVSATTGGGDITLGPVNGSAEAHTGAGDVTVRIVGRGDARHDVYVTTGNGRADVWLPDDISARLELETAYTNNFYRATRIGSDWDIPVRETADWDDREGTPRRYVRSTTTLGGGRGLVRVRVVNGDIRVHKYKVF